MIDGISLILAERETQIGKGYTAAYDDAYNEAGALAFVASVLIGPPPKDRYMAALENARPIEAKCMGDRIRQLTVAGALIVAEIERLQREQGR
jgi:hypothetical protein